MRLADLETVRTSPHPDFSYVEELNVFVHPMLAPVIEEIRAELATEAYKDRPHGRCSTNNAGCSGPLCHYARREWWHDNYRRKRERLGKTYRRRYNAAHEFTQPLFQLFIQRINTEWERKQLTAQLEKLLSQDERRPKLAKSVTPAESPTSVTRVKPAPLMIPVLTGSVA